MKFSTTAALAVLASSACVSAAPLDMNSFGSDQTLVKREQVNEILEILQEIQNFKAKRDVTDNEEELMELLKREGSAFSDLISSILNSGLIKDVFNKLISDPTIINVIKGVVQAAFKTAAVQGVALAKALYNSGLLGDIFNKIVNDQGIKGAFLDLIKGFLSNASAIFFPSAAPAAGSSKREEVKFEFKREELKEITLPEGEYLDKRDLADVIGLIVNAVKSSGLVQQLIQKVFDNPQQTIDFLTWAFKTGTVAATEVYNWSKESGVLDSMLNYIKANGGTWAGYLGNWLSEALKNGTVTQSDLQQAASAQPAAATTTTAATASGTGSDPVLSSLAAKYGQKKRQLY
ncbi:uncharacterized protein SPAPADRAFT_61536 [Spathaspora passalidarum NRRL Y-27907]|uniref:Opaque-phase-specific protein OP4 n=1 Tax=Spathaspora passalidarum (strain NRRL Y-27907 / 11-Y1) TaxID=619300 RepID=G3AN84_SPAPN|nr:uncharacterized protein SPAPADRAFT_61536 [Spathaspora passalidarum NRRL Y-27907]EGW32467.1 hypothetical protein SPAPADRAFT_61536 [Spathaspora passalidarum NRRL Y-27907]